MHCFLNYLDIGIIKMNQNNELELLIQNFLENQEELEEPFTTILNDNLWDLLEQ